MLSFSEVNEITKKFIKSLVNINLPEKSRMLSPWGIESKPIKGTKSAVMDTISSTSVCIGYIMRESDLKEGETRIYATDTDGEDAGDLYINEKGEFLFSSGSDFAIKFGALDSAIKSGIIEAINAELVKIATGIGTAGGSYTPQPLSFDMSEAKAENIKI